jgi:hypothetical protein
MQTPKSFKPYQQAIPKTAKRSITILPVIKCHQEKIKVGSPW